MSASLPHNISDQTLTFFAKGRPYEVQRSHKHFDMVRSILLGWGAEVRTERDIESLIAVADPREEVIAASDGQLSFEGSQLVYEGQRLHNLWADKIITFRDKGEAYEPIFLALQDLQRNPTPAARERLPIFVERSKLGFLPDGRIAAFKGVRNNYNDVHSNTVNYAVGKTVAIPREACNADPNQTCVAGLHVGAIDYIKDMGYGWGRDRRMLLTAFWPRHAVAVPTDYRGGKMRVEQLEVLDEVDRDYVDRLLNNGTTVIRGFDPSPHGYSAPLAPAASAAPTTTEHKEPFELVKVGDWIEVEGDSGLSDGTYKVTSIDDDTSSEYRVKVLIGDSDTENVDNDAVSKILDEAPVWARAKVGDWVQFLEYGDSYTGQVSEVDEKADGPDDQRLKIAGIEGDDWVGNDDIESILASPPPVWLRVRDSDTIRIEGHAFLKDGEYEVVGLDRDGGEDADGNLVEVRAGDENDFYLKNDVIKSIKREEDEARSAGEAATAVTAPAPVAPAEPAWKTAKVGDMIRITGSSRQKDGDYEIDRVDDNAYNMNRRLRVKGASYLWVDNRSVDSIVTPAPVSVTSTDTRPIWEQVLPGDKIEIARSNGVPAGNYTVEGTDDALRNGPGSLGIRLTRGDWIVNREVLRIVERNGQPFGTAAVEEKEPWDLAEVGDVVRIESSSWIKDGEYTVSRVKTAEQKAGSGSPFGGNSAKYGIQISEGSWYIEKSAVKAIVRKAGAAAPTTSTEPAYKRAKVGDTIRVTKGMDHPAGDFEVTRVSTSLTTNFRLAVNYGGRNGAIWWIADDKVVEIITEAPAKAA